MITALIGFISAGALLAAPTPASRATTPPGATRIPIENIEGLIFLAVDLHEARDTSGLMVLDTGAGFLGLDRQVARNLGVDDDSTGGIEFAQGALDRLRLGDLAIEQVSPLLLLDLDVVQRVSGRPAIGLLGQRVFTGRALWIDYEAEEIAILPDPPDPEDDTSTGTNSADPRRRLRDASRQLPASRAVFGGLLSPAALATPFQLVGDGKMLVRVHVGDAPSRRRKDGWLNLVFDTGATECVAFDPDFSRAVPNSRRWRSIDGLVAPTLIGDSHARLTLAPWTRIETVTLETPPEATRPDVEFAIVESDLAATLEASIGETVHGLLGYSFLRNYRIGIDFTRRIVWLDPVRRSLARDHEHSHIGVQLETVNGEIRIAAVAGGSPADRAGIAPGDVLSAVDAKSVQGRDIVEVTHWLEGRPGTPILLKLQRGSDAHEYRLTREKLL